MTDDAASDIAIVNLTYVRLDKSELVLGMNKRKIMQLGRYPEDNADYISAITNISRKLPEADYLMVESLRTWFSRREIENAMQPARRARIKAKNP